MKKLFLFIFIPFSTFVISAEYELRPSWDATSGKYKWFYQQVPDDKDIKDCQNKVGYYEKIECFELLQKKSEEERSRPLPIISAKQKCSDIGYKIGTDKHSKCVLELIK